VVGCCECGDEPSGSCATELVSYLSVRLHTYIYSIQFWILSSNLTGGSMDVCRRFPCRGALCR
jgi:hypothetical protein